MYFSTLCLTAALLPLAYSASTRSPVPAGVNIINANIAARDIVPDSYLLVYKNSASASEISEHHAQILAVTGSAPASIFNLPGFKGVHVKTDSASLAEISSPQSIVNYVELDSITTVEPLASTIRIERRITVTQDNAPWGLGRISRRPVNGDGSNYKYDSPACNNTLVYVIDTGVNINHTEFAGGRAIWGTNLVTGSPDNDENGHGTHCAGTVVGSTVGVCKQGKVISVKVFGSGTNSGSVAVILNAISWAYYDAFNRGMFTRSVLSMSLDFGSVVTSINDIINAVVTNGVPVVVAAGNNNVNANGTSPASAPGAITVGATSADDKRASFSNFGPVLDILAPGDSIRSSWIPCDTCYNTISGTSMATPHVAGIAAYLINKEGLVGAAVVNRINALATLNALTELAGSPNRLAYNGGGT